MLAIMKKNENGHHFININCTEKFKLPTPKVWVSGFLSINRNGISVLPIMKKSKNGHHFINTDLTQYFQFTNPQKFGSLVLQVSMEMEYQCQPI